MSGATSATLTSAAIAPIALVQSVPTAPETPATMPGRHPMFDKAIDFSATATNAFAAEAEQLARAFAAEYPTPNVRQAIALCESGRLRWVDVAALFARSFGQARAEVGA